MTAVWPSVALLIAGVLLVLVAAMRSWRSSRRFMSFREVALVEPGGRLFLRRGGHRRRRLPKHGSLRFAARRHENGDGYETCSSPRHRVGSENPDLLSSRPEGAQVIDAGLQRAARVRRAHRSTPTMNLELTVRLGCARGSAPHSRTFDIRSAAKRSSSSRGSDWPPHPMTSSRMPIDIDSSSVSCPGPGAPCLSLLGRALPI